MVTTSSMASTLRFNSSEVVNRLAATRMPSISACFTGVAIERCVFHKCVPNSSVSMSSMGRTLHKIDEPTIGSRFEDIRLFLNVLEKLVDRGNSVRVIGHNPHVKKLLILL